MLIFEHFNEDDVEFALTESQNPYAVFGELRAGMPPPLPRRAEAVGAPQPEPGRDSAVAARRDA
jgi:hypothetical protein